MPYGLPPFHLLLLLPRSSLNGNGRKIKLGPSANTDSAAKANTLTSSAISALWNAKAAGAFVHPSSYC